MLELNEILYQLYATNTRRNLAIENASAVWKFILFGKVRYTSLIVIIG